MYERVLVPLDGSELAECVLPYVKSAISCGDVKEVTFINVVEPTRLTMGGEITIEEDLIRKNQAGRIQFAKDYLEKKARELSSAGITSQTVVLEGPPAATLVDYAHNNKADLIIIATHGRSGVSRWVMGSVADRILRSAATPVMMIPAPGCRIFEEPARMSRAQVKTAA